MTPLRAADILDKVAELLAQRNQDLVLILDRLCARVRGAVQVRALGGGRRPSRKGINSSRVRSAPKARAMVERRRIALRRRMTSSCYAFGQPGARGGKWAACGWGEGWRRTLSSSMSTAMG